MGLKTDDIENMFGYHRATAESAPQHHQVRESIKTLAHHFNSILPEGRDKALCMTKLQEAMHWANSAIAMQNDVDKETPHLPNA